MIISLIGMSGSGKSYWSKKLRPYGFRRICCDDIIEHHLAIELKERGFSGIRDVAHWMGQPYDPQYPKTSKKYLEIEEKVMKSIIQKLKYFNADKNLIIDTTGSLIYISEEVLKELKRYSTMLYLEIPEKAKKRMLSLYLNDPKPVIWGESYSQLHGESRTDAIRRCYPKLLEYRTKRYEALADVVLLYETRSAKTFNVTQLLDRIHTFQHDSACFF